MSTSFLPIFPLPFPFVCFPSARLTIPLPRASGDALLDLIRDSDTQPVVAAIPLLPSNSYTLHEWGTAARITRLIRPASRYSNDSYTLTLQGISRVRLLENQSGSVRVDAIVERKVEYPLPDGVPSDKVVATFKASAFKLLDRLARDAAQQSKRDAYIKISNMVDEITDQKAPWMADVIMSGINVEYGDKLEYLAAAEVDDRLKRATTIFVKLTSISEVSQKIAQSVDESLSKQQKEFFLRQQLLAIQRELRNLNRSSSSSGPVVRNSLGDGPAAAGDKTSGSGSELDDDEQAEMDDMADIRTRIEAMAKDSEERKMAGSVEYGVIRNYLEWLTAIPWPSSSTTVQTSASLGTLRDRAFLANARTQLDADHFGLEKIKKRLIEYLAIVRLKELNAEKEVREHTEDSRDATTPEPQLAVAKAEQSIAGHNSGSSMPTIQVRDEAKPRQQLPKRGAKGPILLFVGPPGTGKTSLGQSIARALNRPFQRISLGGVRDEAEIRGHRRTYVASGPGSIAQALRKAGRPDPVILLDEIDKVGQSNVHGDPSAALLEVLDPEQNYNFTDHYINVPIDLSQVLFICTSNTLDTIAAPLLDRCEIVQLSGYTYDEKMHIARKFLLPKQLQANGLTTDHLTLTDPALLHIATHYTREAGVRSLERAIGAVARHKAVDWAEHVDSLDIGGDSATQEYNRVVEEHELEKILGIARWDEEEREREERRGLVYGLVVSGLGEGGILPVETTVVPGSGKLILTGSLGSVIKESGELALSWVKTHAFDLCITKSRAQDPLKVPDPIDIHLHLPAGAVKKDGPSAGIAMTCAFVSLLTGACVPSNVAMTGEVTLRGRVGPVGGIKEKVLGAHRAQITKVILPWGNRKDVEHDVPPEVRAEVVFVFVRTVEEALEAAFGPGAIAWRRNVMVMESRL
ncbi:ATP-dependent protease La [Amylocystis lapponica]|nr:ATP-dependent protease La [Amylocystis lapponica]